MPALALARLLTVCLSLIPLVDHGKNVGMASLGAIIIAMATVLVSQQDISDIM